jgi:protein O-GlcNAc transferase
MTHTKAGRNDPCPCGSGKKYKQCCQGKDSAPAAPPPSPAIPGLIREAMAHHQAGRLPAAEALYRQVLQLAPEQPDALHLLGVLASQVGKYDVASELIARAIAVHPTAPMYFNLANALKGQGALALAIDSYQAALALQPGYVDALRNLGLAHREHGELAKAVGTLRQALALAPQSADLHANLGLALKESGQAEQALASYRRAIALQAGHAEAHNNLGVLLKEQGQLHAAVESYQKAVALDPAYVEALGNLGNAFVDLALFDRAADVLADAVRLRPDFAEAHSNLGNALASLGKLDAALGSYRRALQLQPQLAVARNNMGALLARQGRFDEAIACYEAALASRPDYAEAHYNLGNAFKDLERYPLAVASYARALGLRPDYAEAWTNLGNAQKALGKLDDAIGSYAKALQCQPDLAVAHSNMAVACLDLGKPAEAMACARRALDLQPDYHEAHSNLLFAMCCDGAVDSAAYFAEALRYGERVQAAARPFASWQEKPAGRPLRLGIVSGDLRAHPVGFFLEALLGQLDPARIELAAYATQPGEDSLTARIRPHFRTWRAIAQLDDASAARLIHDDGIDVLLDLAGHTAHNRLPVFAWKPAPVQASWLGYFASTGVAAIDYLLADAVSVPPGHADRFSETVLHLPDTRLCFTAPSAAIAVSPLPALARGHLTFGCFQNLTKVTDAVLALWQGVFAQLPGARLFMQSRQLNEPDARQAMLARLGAIGLGPERVTLEGYAPREAYLAAHQHIDIVLDTFPYPGGTTTCEALWMGVPTLALAGTTMLARQGASLLGCAGLGDWVAHDARDYTAMALARAADLPALAALRAGLRAQVLASPLFDAARFARRFEQAVEAMWHARAGTAPTRH